jgi:hypothetical protein
MKRMGWVGLGLVLGCLSAGAALPFTISGLTRANWVAGPELTEADLEGKVIFFEHWGSGCNPCLQVMPELQRLWETYGKTGKFMVIGNHIWARDDEKVRQIVQQKGVTFPVYQGLRLPFPRSSGGVPHTHLIDGHGRCVADGHPGEMIGRVEALIQACPDRHPIFGLERPVHYAGLWDSVRPGRNIEPAMQELARRAAAGGPAATEAAKLLAACEAYKAAQVREVSQAVAASAERAIPQIAVLKQTFPSVREFDAVYARLGNHPDFAKLAKLRQDVDTLTAQVEAAANHSARQRVVRTAGITRQQYAPLMQSSLATVREESKALLAKLDALSAKK